MFGNIYNASMYATAADPLSNMYQNQWGVSNPALSMMAGAVHPSFGGAFSPFAAGSLAGLGGISNLGALGVNPQLLSQCPSPYAHAQYAATAGVNPSVMSSPALQHQAFALHGPATGAFGARGTPFNIPAGGATVLAELQEVGKDIMIDRARDFHHLEIIHDLLDARCHGRQLDTIIQALVRGIPVPPQILAQVLVQERQIDHAADNTIRTIINESKYNRRSDEILSNFVSGRPHLRRYDEAIKNRKDDAFDAVIDNKAAQVCLAAAGGNGWLPLTRNRAKKQLVAVRELITRSPLTGTPGLNAILNIGPVALSLRHSGVVQGISSLIDSVTAGGSVLGSAIASGGVNTPFGGPHLGALGAFSSFSPIATAGWNPIHSAACNPLAIQSSGFGLNPFVAGGVDPFTSGLNPLASAVNPMFASAINPLASAVNPLASAVNPMLASAVNPMLASAVNPMLASAVNPMLASAVNPMLASAVNPMLASGLNPLTSAINPIMSGFNPILTTGFNPLTTGVNPLLASDPMNLGLTQGLTAGFAPQSMGYGAASMLGSGIGSVLGASPLWNVQNANLGAGLGGWNPFGSANVMAY